MPFRIYADSEATLKPVSGPNGEFQQHIPCGFCFHTVSETDEVFSPVLIRGENCFEEFVDKLVFHVRNLQNKKRKRIVWKEGEREKFQNAKFCWFCGGDFMKTGKVADHCHFTGRFRGAAHPDCNLKATRPRFTPVFFHNLAYYDAHLFIKALGEKYGKIKCIPNTEEKYISFSLQITLRMYIFQNLFPGFFCGEIFFSKTLSQNPIPFPNGGGEKNCSKQKHAAVDLKMGFWEKRRPPLIRMC